MQQKFTRHQVPRGSLSDSETLYKIYLIKNVSFLNATYQIKLLAFKAVQTNKRLVLKVPKTCRFRSNLKNLIKDLGKTIEREDL